METEHEFMSISDLEHKESCDAFNNALDSLHFLDKGQKLELIKELQLQINKN